MELGIVLGVSLLLMTALVATIKGVTDTARSQRTGEEMASIANAGVQGLKRGLVQDLATNSYSFRIAGGAATAALSWGTPLCYDLSRVSGAAPAACRASGAPGPNWNASYTGAANPIPSNSPLMPFFGGGGRVYGNGYNAWCLPYVVCLFPHRVDVVTCVPRDAVGAVGLESAMSCGACATPSPVTNEPTQCVLQSVSAWSDAKAQTNLSYSPEEPGIAPGKVLLLPPYDPTPRAVF